MISGSLVALVTPMHPDSLDVDWDALYNDESEQET